MRLLNIVLIGMFLILQYRFWIGEGGVRHVVDLEARVKQQQELNATLEERNAVMSAQVVSLQQGHEGLEEYARSQLGMIKPTEMFYLVVDSTPK